MRISDWSSDVCSSDLGLHLGTRRQLSTKRKAREATIWDSRASAAGEGRDPIYDSIFEKALRAITRVREGTLSIEIVEVEGSVAAIVSEIPADDQSEVRLGCVTFGRDIILGSGLHALKIILADEVDHAAAAIGRES